ncbi:MAG: hypothetical protein M1833_004181 [Piccolia ochrophora]|nr:MAG: hypothetical protein M1833_004181 [Piccolia ochrophora]
MEEARVLARVARDRLKDEMNSVEVQVLFLSLFSSGDRLYVMEVLRLIHDIAILDLGDPTASPWMTIFCGDDHLHFEPEGETETEILRPRWCDEGGEDCLFIHVPKHATEAKLQRRPCMGVEGTRTGAISYLYENLIICSYMFGIEHQTARAPLEYSMALDRSHGGMNFVKFPLDAFKPLSATMIHHLTHLDIGDNYRCADFPVPDHGLAYDTATCQLLNRFNSEHARRNAENYARLAVGLYLRDYDWGTGVGMPLTKPAGGNGLAVGIPVS